MPQPTIKKPTTQIIDYHPRYQPRFYELNRSWIEHFHTLEDEDERFLSNPQGEIIDKGGMVFFLLEGEEAMGTCGVMKMDEGIYELVRMAVDEEYYGKGYGKQLLNHAINWLRQAGASELILETSTRMKTAIAMYEKYGFKHYKPNPKHRSALDRAEIFMQLCLK